jgi:hypothetical protein
LSDVDGGIAYTDGLLRLTVLTNEVEWRAPSGRVDAVDVAVSVAVPNHSGPERGDFGLICRWQDGDNYVALAVSGAGQVAIWHSLAGEVAFLSDWSPVSGATLGEGGTLTLTATCLGPALRLESGAQLLAEAADPAPASGDIALLARLRQPGELVVDFDDLVVAAP